MTAGVPPKTEKGQESPYTLDDAMLRTGFGWYNIAIMLLSGLILMGMIMETLGLGYVIPAAQCDLDLTLQQKGWLAAIPFIAIIITSHLWGWLADTRGRRPVMLFSMIIAVILSCLSSLSPNLLVFALLRFLASIFISGPSGVAYAYLGEFNSIRHRDKMVTFGAAFVGIGTVVLPALSWLILPLDFSLPLPALGINYRSWRLLVVACSMPYAISCLALLWAPESPKYLHAKGQTKACLQVLGSIYKINHRTSEKNYPVKVLLVENCDTNESRGEGIADIFRSMRNQTAPLFRSPLLPWTCLACFVQLGIFATANGFYVWFPTILNSLANHADKSNASESIRICDVLGNGNLNQMNDTLMGCSDAVNTATFSRAIIVGLVFCSMYVVVGFIVDFVGKRIILVVILGFAGVCGVVAEVVSNQQVAVALFAIFQMSGACIGLLTAVVVELFPTKLRAMAVCLSLMSGRVGSVLGSNLIGMLLEKNCAISFYLFGGLLMLCSALCLTLPGKGKSISESREAIQSSEIDTTLPI